MKSLLMVLAVSWAGLWFTPDQQGQRQFRRGDYSAAAQAFRDPLWRGTARYRAGDFEQAAQEFSRSSTPEALFNQGNALVMLGKYDQAITSYQRALKRRPDWTQAQQNRDLALARSRLMQQEGGDLGDQQVGADEIVFDRKKPPGGQETVVAGDQASSDTMVQALWLRRVQTRPADFLKAKFAYQQAQKADGSAP